MTMFKEDSSLNVNEHFAQLEAMFGALLKEQQDVIIEQHEVISTYIWCWFMHMSHYSTHNFSLFIRIDHTMHRWKIISIKNQ